jgi:hypothetical protein
MARWRLVVSRFVLLLGVFGALAAPLPTLASANSPLTTGNGATAQTASQTIFATPGEIVGVQISYLNSGTTTWTTRGGYALHQEGIQGVAYYGKRIGLNQSTCPGGAAPGAVCTWNVAINAGPVVGTWQAQFVLVQGRSGSFGDVITITVNTLGP